MAPKVSVIIPVYNVECYLARCLDSVLAQTYTDFELILVDDGSTDGSPAICDSYAKRDERVRVFRQENKGVSAARNLGIEEVHGEWVYFCDSDDEMEGDCLMTLVSSLSEGVDMVMGGYSTIDDGKDTYCTSFQENRIISPTQTIDCLFTGVYQGYIFTKLFKRSVILDNGLKLDESIRFNEDRLFSVSYLTKMKGDCIYVNHSLYRYIIRANSAMSSLKKGFNRNFVTDFYAFEQMLSLLKNYGYKNVFRVKYQMYCSYKTICGMAKSEADSEVISTSLFDSLKMDLSCWDLVTIRLYDLYIKMRNLAGRIVRMVFTHN